MNDARHLAHPGPALLPRVEIVAGPGEIFEVVLEAGLTLQEAIVQALSARGVTSACLSFGPVRLDPLVYYLPAVLEGPMLRFWYSDGQKPDGGGDLECAAASFGLREGAPFVHCHAVWTERDGRRHGGHVVPGGSVLARPVAARVATLAGAQILSEHDPETDYQLFHPVRAGGEDAGRPGRRLAYARVKPNEDLCLAVEGTCRDLGYRSATLRGLGSLIGARFEDGTERPDQGSEVLLTSGRVTPGEDGAPRAEIDVVFSGFSGLAFEGRLRRGQNPVCITFELLIEEAG